MKLKTTLVLLLLSSILFSFQWKNKTHIPLGIVAQIEKDSLVYASGFKLIGESVGKMISPSLSEETFKNNLELIKKSKCKLYMCNVMFASQMKIAGPDVKEQEVLAYADGLFSRAERAGVPLIVLGSGGARRLPDQYDVKKAQTDFVILCKKLAVLAQKHKVRIALENLQSSETNFLTSLKSTAEVVRLVNHPNFKLNADIYHMRREQESPQSIIDAGDILIHCEIAENDERTLPGIKGDDFRPYLIALKNVNYKGPIFIEANKNYSATEIALSFNFLTKEINAVFTD